MFERFALDLIAAGWKRYSADAILQRIRWHHTVERGDREWKLNDHWRKRLSVGFATKYPEHENFFEFRRAPRKSDPLALSV